MQATHSVVASLLLRLRLLLASTTASTSTDRSLSADSLVVGDASIMQEQTKTCVHKLKTQQDTSTNRNIPADSCTDWFVVVPPMPPPTATVVANTCNHVPNVATQTNIPKQRTTEQPTPKDTAKQSKNIEIHIMTPNPIPNAIAIIMH